MINLDYDIGMIQESRLTKAGNLTHFHIHLTPAERGYGGLLTMIRKSPHTTIHTTVTVSPRIHITTFVHHSKHFHLVNAHAPTKLSPPATHAAFQQDLIKATSTVQPHHYLICGFDLNAKLQDLHEEYTIVGPYTTKRIGQTHISALLDHWQAEQLTLVNTITAPYDHNGQLIPPNADATHDHIVTQRQYADPVNSPTHQIDYILANPIVQAAVVFCQPLQWCTFDTLHQSDHRPLAIHIRLQHHTDTTTTNHTTRKPIHKRFIDQQHQTDTFTLFHQLLPQLHNQHDPHTTPPHTQLMLLQQLIQHCLQQAAPKHTLVPKK
eukprot:6492275-Amphidinium_carterae.2